MKKVAGVAKCQECQQNVVFVHFGEEKLCLDCYNGRMEKRFGVAATHYPEGVSISALYRLCCDKSNSER